MEMRNLSSAIERLACVASRSQGGLCSTQQRLLLWRTSRRALSSTSKRTAEPFQAAPEIDFDSPEPISGQIGQSSGSIPLLKRVRVVPASPSYFTSRPRFTDTLLELRSLLRRHEHLPITKDPPQVAFKTLAQYTAGQEEKITGPRYQDILRMLQRLNEIHVSLRPAEVSEALERHLRDINPYDKKARPKFVDEWGRALGVGRRKSSTARAYVVEGEGECIVNGRGLADYFGRVHDRESALWALKVTQRLGRYNVWALVSGGGSTGQAEAMLLAVAKALCVLEPALESKLRFAGSLMRDPRKVERKKPGHLKARKMPTWVKR